MARDELFDLAVNRARTYARRLGAIERSDGAGELARRLELWYLRTRFAYRVPLDGVAAAVWTDPGGDVHWSGGPDGGWRPGPPTEP